MSIVKWKCSEKLVFHQDIYCGFPIDNFEYIVHDISMNNDTDFLI